MSGSTLATPSLLSCLITKCWRGAYVGVGVLLLPIWLILSYRKHGKGISLWAWWRMKMGFPLNPTHPDINDPTLTLWIHGVSLGEIRTAGLMLSAWRENYPERFSKLHLVLTFHTATGSQAARAIVETLQTHSPHLTITTTFMPIDLPWVWRRFFASYRPNCLLLMEGEWWPALSWACTQHHCKWIMVNARMSPKSFSRHLSLQSWGLKNFWSSPTTVISQDSAQGARWKVLSPNSVHHVGGQIKYAVRVSPSDKAQGESLRTLLSPNKGSPILMLASSREGEEAIGYAIWKYAREALMSKGISLRLLVVPRHPERMDWVYNELRDWGKTCGDFVKRKSEWVINDQFSLAEQNINVWLGDTMGEMLAYYHAASMVIMGGSLLPYGGQNPLEAFAVGVPVLLGPHTYNFALVREEAIQQGAAWGTMSEDRLVESLANDVVRLATSPSLVSTMLTQQQILIQRHQSAMTTTINYLESTLGALLSTNAP